MKWPGFLQPLLDFSAAPAEIPARVAAKPRAGKARNSAEEAERSIALDGRRVDYKLVRRRGRRGIGLKIDGSGMTVAASLTTPIGLIEDMIGKNESRALKKLGEREHGRVPQQVWVTGSTVYY